MKLTDWLKCKLFRAHEYRAIIHGAWIRTYCKRPGCVYEDWHVRGDY